MGVRGPKPAGKVKLRWSADLAYPIGLLASDGCLSPSGRHIVFVSKDFEQIENYLKALNIQAHIGTCTGGLGHHTWRVQCRDILFYEFLQSIGLMPNKRKIIGAVAIPGEFFFDFLRGCFDGDGSFYSYWDPRWRTSFMYYLSFASASRQHIEWLRSCLEGMLGVHGHVTTGRKGITCQLKYAKRESIKIIRAMYRMNGCIHLSRKRLKIEEALRILGERL